MALQPLKESWRFVGDTGVQMLSLRPPMASLYSFVGLFTLRSGSQVSYEQKTVSKYVLITNYGL
jgi:hypothetical protein